MALVIDATFGGDDPRVRSAAEALASMPDWLERHRLDLWEDHVYDAFPLVDQSSLPLCLLEDVLEFGRFNLYAPFRDGETAEEFMKLVARARQHGLVFDQDQQVSDW